MPKIKSFVDKFVSENEKFNAILIVGDGRTNFFNCL